MIELLDWIVSLVLFQVIFADWFKKCDFLSHAMSNHTLGPLLKSYDCY
jgi:hypothetical protein